MLRADYVEAGQFPVVLANRFGGVIFHEACGHLLETTQVERATPPAPSAPWRWTTRAWNPSALC
jgi:predicted Zn-dependent protease